MAARAGKIPARTQSSVAISADGERWFLINASPDLRAQIEGNLPLQPSGEKPRQTPIEGVLLTNADLDHVLGILALREGAQIVVHSTEGVRETLVSCLHFDAILNAFGGVLWRDVPSTFDPLIFRNAELSGLQLRGIELPGGPPRFAGECGADHGHSMAFQIRDEQTGGVLLIAPDVSTVTPELHDALCDSDAILFDGTFWSDDELQRVSSGARTSRQMGHLPIQDGSLSVLRAVPAATKIYLHINNTNPILAAFSPERVEVEGAGVRIGLDGMNFTL